MQHGIACNNKSTPTQFYKFHSALQSILATFSSLLWFSRLQRSLLLSGWLPAESGSCIQPNENPLPNSHFHFLKNELHFQMSSTSSTSDYQWDQKSYLLTSCMMFPGQASSIFSWPLCSTKKSTSVRVTVAEVWRKKAGIQRMAPSSFFRLRKKLFLS